MPKKSIEINPFDGGLNNFADARDIKENELATATNINTDQPGRIRIGKRIHSVAARTGIADIQAGLGLFHYNSDYASDSSEGNTEYQVIFNTSTNALMRRTTSDTNWTALSSLGAASRLLHSQNVPSTPPGLTRPATAASLGPAAPSITPLQARCCTTSSTPRWACGLVLPLPPAGPDLLVRRIELKLRSAAFEATLRQGLERAMREVAPTSRAGRGVRGWWSRRRLRGRAEKALRAEGVVERYLRE